MFKICLAFIFCITITAWAAETDQYTVPPQPLADLDGPFQKIMHQRLQKIMDRLNGEFASQIAKADRAGSDSDRDNCLDDASYELTAQCLSEAVYSSLGIDDAIKLTKELLAVQIDDGTPTSFNPSLGKTIYAGTAATLPLSLVPPAPTVRINNVYLGTDKLGHIFQQGYDYRSYYLRAIAAGKTEAEAHDAMVRLGIIQEHTYFGEGVDWVYSNADLAGNYAGFLFYRNLTEPMKIRGVLRPPILVVHDQHWQFNPDAGEHWMRPFFSDHLDESLNPCHYDWPIHSGVEANINGRMDAWRKFRGALKSEDLKSWFGEEYGYWP